jgi:hypothetical protein
MNREFECNSELDEGNAVDVDRIKAETINKTKYWQYVSLRCIQNPL